MRDRIGDHAVVVGGSIAGLLAARVLTEAYPEVTVVDRDDLVPGSVPRRGVPQARHIHALLAGGQQALEQLLPGLTAELAAHGAPVGDVLGDAQLVFGGHRLARANSGLVAVSASRPLLEDQVRARVRTLPGIAFAPASDAVGLRSSPQQRRITGIRLLRRADGSAAETLDADLVVDATGRGTRSPVWLEALGFDRPDEDRVRVDVAYATRRYRLAPDALDGGLAYLLGPTPQRPRGAALARLEGDVSMLTLFGYRGHHPPTDPTGFNAFLAALRCPDLHDAIHAGTPIDDPAPFRYPANIRRRWERVRRLPDGFVATGDAVCSFNPIYGQGMTVAALQAVALQRCLEHGDRRLTRRFIHTAAKIADHAWKMATGADLAVPNVDGPRTVPLQLVNAYTDRLLRVAATNPTVAVAFIRVAGMVDPLPTLARPTIALRVLRSGPYRERR